MNILKLSLGQTLDSSAGYSGTEALGLKTIMADTARSLPRLGRFAVMDSFVLPHGDFTLYHLCPLSDFHPCTNKLAINEQSIVGAV